MTQAITYHPFTDIKDKILPFDLIAFRDGSIIGNIVSALEKMDIGTGEFSHVGIAITSDILPHYTSGGKTVVLQPGKLYIYESTITSGSFSDGVPDLAKCTGTIGVQIRDLEELIPRYIDNNKTRVAWCKLKNNPVELADEQGKLAIRDKFMKLHAEYNERLYEMDIYSLLSSLVPAFRPLREIYHSILDTLFSKFHKFSRVNPAGWVFCSELVAIVYKSIGVLDTSFDPQNVTPVDFFGQDADGIPALVETPVYIQDWDVPGQPAVVY